MALLIEQAGGAASTGREPHARRGARRAAPARAGDLRLARRSRAHRALPPRARQRRRPAVRLAAVRRRARCSASREIAERGTPCQTQHPIIAVTGSSRRRHHLGDAHLRAHLPARGRRRRSHRRRQLPSLRPRRDEASACADADHGEGRRFSHFGPESNLFDELESCSASYGESGRGQRRDATCTTPARPRRTAGAGHVHRRGSDARAAPTCCSTRACTAPSSAPEVDVARHVDLLIGVVPIINLEWIQKLHRDQTLRGYCQEAVTDTILRRMPDYVNYICPQFCAHARQLPARADGGHLNPFIARDIPTPTRAMVVIRFANPKGIDFPYLLSMLHDSCMSRRQHHRVPGRQDGAGDAADLHADDPAADGPEAARA